MFVHQATNAKVQIVVMSMSIVEVVLSFHSSELVTLQRSTLTTTVVVQNTINYYGAVCFYPHLTLVDKIGVVFDHANNKSSFDTDTYKMIAHTCSCFPLLYTSGRLVSDH